MNRNLDGIYHRVERNGKWENVCFTDLTEEELEDVTLAWDKDVWKRTAMHLRDVIRVIGNSLDIVKE